MINFEKITKECDKLGIKNFLGSVEKELKSIESILLENINPIELLKFQNLKIINAFVLSVEDHPDPKFTKLWLMKVNSEIGEIQLLCNLKTELKVEDMLNKEIMIVIGLPKRIIGNIESSAMFYRFITKMKTAIFDIDDTLIDSEYGGLIHNVVEKLKELKSENYCIVILSNRDENFYLETKKDLSGLSYDYLFLRDSDNFRINQNVKFKKTTLEYLQRKGHLIEYFFDDQIDNCQMAKNLEIPEVFLVTNGKVEKF